ncbi:MAG: hypothetical protein ABIJ30_04180 [bacterium]
MKKIVLIAILVLTTFPFQANASMSDATLEFQGVFVNQTTHNQLLKLRHKDSNSK